MGQNIIWKKYFINYSLTPSRRSSLNRACAVMTQPTNLRNIRASNYEIKTSSPCVSSSDDKTSYVLIVFSFYSQQEKEEIGELYQDEKNQAALLVHSDKDGGLLVVSLLYYSPSRIKKAGMV